MLIDLKNVDTICNHIIRSTILVIDTETTGLEPYKQDVPFAIVFAVHDYVYTLLLTEESFPLKEKIKVMLGEYKGIIGMHNAKFDMAMLEKVGIVFSCPVFCTMAAARVYDNTLSSLQLSDLASLVGEKKSDKVKAYCLEHTLWEWEIKAGAKKRSKKFFYNKVPSKILVPYAEQDARITLKLFNLFHADFHKRPHLAPVYNNEIKLTKVLYDMEKVGILLDVPYVLKAIEDQQSKALIARGEYLALTGEEFKDSNKAIERAFIKLGLEVSRTELGNPSFTDKLLSAMDSPLANVIQRIRDHEGRVVSYRGLIASTDQTGIIHSNAKQSGCTTGRMSYSNPPMQCMEKVDPSDYTPEELQTMVPIRRAFIPRPDYMFVMMDFDQFEYRMMVNCAKEEKLQKKIMSGMCVHTATGEMLGITRKQAKTINFSLLYGSGVENLAGSLKVKNYEARNFKLQYFSELPHVEHFINTIIHQCKVNKVLTNWFGREYKFEPDFAYKGPNFYIQGGTAEWIKIAMTKISVFLKDTKSRMLLQIHDELLFEIHKTEEHLIPIIREIMESVSTEKPHSPLKYTVGIDYSYSNWQDKEEWHETRNLVS